jgi:hypothetical protein
MTVRIAFSTVRRYVHRVMSPDAGAPKSPPHNPLTTKNGRPLTVWDVRIERSGQTVRQSAWSALAAWVGSGVAGLIYWWVRSVQKHGEITQRDIDEWPHFVAFYLIVAGILFYLFFRNVLPTARKDLAKLQEEAKRTDTHSSTKPPGS